MNYNDQYFYQKLEFNVMIEKLQDIAILKETKDFFGNVEPFKNINEIRTELKKVDEMYRITNRFERTPIYNSMPYLDLLSICTKDGILTGKQIYETVYLNSSIRASLRLLGEMEKSNFPCPYYNEYVNNFFLDSEFDQILRKSVDDNGNVLDEASKDLLQIRRKLKGIDERIKHKLTDIISTQSKYLADTMIVIRDDRYCLCVKAEYKNTFRGILRDQSASLLTLYMEPIATSELANEKEHLLKDEKEEIERILRYLSSEIKARSMMLEANYLVLIELDKLFTKGVLAKSYDGQMCNVNDKGIFDLKNARHPLLKVKKVIPNNISFGNKYYGIIITGPNTGGKTVLLKTVGLLSLMVKFGLLLPCDADSNIMIYDHVFCDIGDDQSIEQNLSTFSSHMTKIVSIVNDVTPHSLALFDEIGSGTDPMEGSAIAIGVIKYFLSHKVNFMTTTHYAELKAFAYEEPRVVNASMEFSLDTLKPTYHLIIGKSGSSNAFSIAKNLGLKDEILDLAKDETSKKNDNVHALITGIEKRYDELSKEKKALDELILENKEKEARLNKELNNIKQKEDKVLKEARLKAKKEAQVKLDEAENLLNNLKAMEEKGLKMHEVIEAKKNFDDVKSDILNEPKKKKAPKKVHKELVVGDRVFLHDYEQYGTISRIRKDKTYDVAIGNITINADESELEYTDVKEEKYEEAPVTYESSGSSKKVGITLDLRGMRYADAKDAMEKYIDDLIVAHINSAQIIHGFGTGAIREMVQDYCKKSKYIKEFRYGGAGEGGLGVTVITLK